MEMLHEIALYVYLGVFFVLTIYFFSSAIHDNRKEKDIEGERGFYFRYKAMGDGLKKRNDSVIPSCIIWAVMAGAFFWVVYVAAGNERIRTLWSGIGKYAEDLPGVMLAGLGAITMLSAFMGFRKDTWIGLNGNVILKRYGIIKRFKQILLVVGASYFILFLSVFIKNGVENDKLYYAVKSLVFFGFVSFLYLFVRCIWSMLEILTGERVALRRIKELYQEFWYTSVSRVERSGREEEIVRMLLRNHKKAACRINLIQKIDAVEFDTNIKERNEEKGRYEKLGLKSCVVFFFFYISVFFVCGFAVLNQCNKSESFFTQCFVFFCSTLVLGASLVLMGKCSKGMRIAAISIVYGRCGYRFIHKSGKDKYVGEVPWITTKYHRYVQVTKCFLAFVLMHLKSGHEDVLKMIIKECKRKLRDNPKLYVDIAILLVVMDYMYYRETKMFLDDIEFTDEHREYYIKAARAFAVDTMDDIYGDEVDMTMFDEYIAERESFFETKKKKGKIKNIQIDIALPKNSKVSIIKS